MQNSLPTYPHQYGQLRAMAGLYTNNLNCFSFQRSQVKASFSEAGVPVSRERDFFFLFGFVFFFFLEVFNELRGKPHCLVC